MGGGPLNIIESKELKRLRTPVLGCSGLFSGHCYAIAKEVVLLYIRAGRLKEFTFLLQCNAFACLTVRQAEIVPFFSFFCLIVSFMY